MLSYQEIKDELARLPSMSALEPKDYAEEDGLANAFVVALGAGQMQLKPTQLRKVFHQVKDLQRQFKTNSTTFDRSRVALIMPTLAYAAGRKLVPLEFYEVMKLCFGKGKCETLDDFTSAAAFLEAIMAYHKYHQLSTAGEG